MFDYLMEPIYVLGPGLWIRVEMKRSLQEKRKGSGCKENQIRPYSIKTLVR